MSTVRALYTFDCRRANDASVCLEAHELGSDAEALAWARKLLGQHRTCLKVEVFEGDRFVGAAAREHRRREAGRSHGRPGPDGDPAGPDGGAA